jgi:hypothetical protein
MSTATAQFNPRRVGYRREIMTIGFAWGGVAAFLPLGEAIGATPGQLAGVTTLLATVLLGYLFRRDSKVLANHDIALPDAWAYALLVPISLLSWMGMVPLVVGPVQSPMLLAFVGLLTGPPIAVMVYIIQRGQRVRAS